jgi:hypothetical protein
MILRRYLIERPHDEAQRYDAKVTKNSLPLPTSQRSAIGLEARRTLRAPYENLIVAGCNGAIVLLAWFTLPAAITGLMWNPHGPDSLAVAMLVWMVADVPATNVFGSDAVRIRAALSRPRQLQEMLRAKGIALWALAATVCVPIDVASGLASGRSVVQAAAIASAMALMPLAVLGLAAFAGALFAYHPIPLRTRYANDRGSPRRLVRWGILVTLPYVLVPALGQLAVIGLTALEHLCSVNVRHASTNTALTTLVVAMLLVTLIINEASYRGLVALTNCSMARLNSQLCNETL